MKFADITSVQELFDFVRAHAKTPELANSFGVDLKGFVDICARHNLPPARMLLYHGVWYPKEDEALPSYEVVFDPKWESGLKFTWMFGLDGPDGKIVHIGKRDPAQPVEIPTRH